MSKLLRWMGVIVFLLVGGMWLVAATNYGDSAAIGKYRFSGNGQDSTLVLTSDHKFQQDLQVGSIKQHREGTWRHVGEGGFEFSKEFLIVRGDEPEPDGTTFSEMHKALGFFPSLELRQYHVLWYGKSKPESDSSVEGRYTCGEEGAPAELTLKADHSFEQTVTAGGIARHASGTWSRATDGTVNFSKAFLKTSGEPLEPDETAFTVGGSGPNLQIEIAISSKISQPVFRRQLW